MKVRWTDLLALAAVVTAGTLIVAGNAGRTRTAELLNVSYEATREMFQELNKQFLSAYQEQTGRKLTIKQSHGGSSRQARAVIEGLEADVVTLALSSDVEALRKRGLVADDWATRLPHHAHPFTSTVVFVVRRGNPHAITDWPDLVRPGVSVVTPNPKTSGNGKLSVLAAWGSVIYRGGSEQEAQDYLRQLFEHVAVLGSGARDASATFTGEKIGDVQLTWESEAGREVREAGGELEVVYPPVSIQAEPSVAWVDTNVAHHQTAVDAKAYLEFLYTEQAQQIMARYGFRSMDPAINERRSQQPKIDLFPITVIADNWEQAQQKFFAENAIFDTIYRPER